MATRNGYQCEFIDVVPDICLCKKCFLVARRLSVTSCCGESFCHDCISEFKEHNKPCPECGEEGFTLFEQKKFQRQVNNLQVYCTLKERGCGWLGPLKQLKSHLDPDQDNCKYVDTECPLNCPMTIPKNKVEQHVTKECVRRDFTCQHCNFKATYEEVIGTHLAECRYVPLQCPNRCGVTCERDVMEDHMRICRLEEVECEFSSVGCEERPKREDQEEHIRQSTQKHMTLMATATAKTREMVDMKHEEIEKKFQSLMTFNKEQEENFRASIQTLQGKYEKQQQDMLQIQQSLLSQIEEKDKQIQELRDSISKITDVQQKTEDSLRVLSHSTRKLQLSNMSFVIDDFKNNLNMGLSDVRSPPVKAPSIGYEFVVYLDYSRSREGGIPVRFVATSAECNDKLKKKLQVLEFDYELLNDYEEKLFIDKWEGYLRFPERMGTDGIHLINNTIPVDKILPYEGRIFFNIVSATCQ